MQLTYSILGATMGNPPLVIIENRAEHIHLCMHLFFTLSRKYIFFNSDSYHLGLRPVHMCKDMLDWFWVGTICGIILRAHMWQSDVPDVSEGEGLTCWDDASCGSNSSDQSSHDPGRRLVCCFVALIWRTLSCNVHFITGSIAPAVLRSLLKEFWHQKQWGQA